MLSCCIILINRLLTDVFLVTFSFAILNYCRQKRTRNILCLVATIWFRLQDPSGLKGKLKSNVAYYT